MAGPTVFVAFQIFLFGITNAQCPVKCNDAKVFGAGTICGNPQISCEGTWHLKDPESVSCLQEWPVGSGIKVPVCKYRRNSDGQYMCFCDPGDLTYGEGRDWQLGLCFDNTATPNLLTFLMNIPSNSYAKCMDECKNHDPTYTYFGLEDGSECFCGFTEPPTTTHREVLQTLCSIPCPGSPLTTCGGTNLMQVYAIPKRLPVWLGGGCYDSTTPLFTKLSNFPVKNSYFHCMAACAAEPTIPGAPGPYTYFGLQNKEECYCGNTQPPTLTHPQVSQSLCSQTCPGAPLTTCGGLGYMQVYAIQEGR